MSIIQVNTIRSKSGSSAPECDQGLVVSGVTTFSSGGNGVKVVAGVVTATTTSSSGIVTYYGDAQYLQNVGVAVTYIPNNVRIVGVTTINSQAHVGSGVTINAQGLRASGIVTALSYRGDGNALTGIVTQIVAGTNITIVSSGTTAGAGIVTISAFDEQNYFQQTATGVHTTSNVGIGTTNSPYKLTVIGDANITGVITAASFTGTVVGVASTATTVTLVPSESDAGVHYVTFVNASSGNEEIRTDTGLNYNPGTDNLNAGIFNAGTEVTTPKVSIGDSVFIAYDESGTGRVGIQTATPTYLLEVGNPDIENTGTNAYIHGDLEVTDHLKISESVNVTGVVTALTYYGNGSGLVGVASTVQTVLREFTTSGIWSKSDYDFKINWVYVQCVGGGGSGNSRTTSSGGGAGGVNTRLFRAQDLPDSVSVLVGLGGASVTNGAGQNGGASSFEVTATNVVRAGGGGGGRAANNGGGYGGDGDLQYAADFYVTNGSTAANVGGHGYASAGGASAGTASVSARGGSSVIGPGGGGAGLAGVGGTTLSLGTPVGGIYGSSMGKGGDGRSGSYVSAMDGGFPGGGGGGNSNTANQSGKGGDGIVRVWAW